MSLLRDDLSIITWVGQDGVRHPLTGGLAAADPKHGVKLKSIKGVGGPFKHLDQQGARQDGVDWLAAYFDPAEIDMKISVEGYTNSDRRRVYRSWLNGWTPFAQGRLSWFTVDLGEWWMMLRQLNTLTSDIPGGHLRTWELDWQARADLPFWQSFPSTSSLRASSATKLVDPTGINPANYCPLFNRGDVAGWPESLAQGPGTFTFGDNGSLTSQRQISIKLKAGEVILLKTLPRIRSATEINSNADVYPRLKNRFSQPIEAGAAVHVPVAVTGATAGITSVKAKLTPFRRWPE